MKPVETKIISGIQQIGIGVPDLANAFRWYRLNFGMDIPIFEDSGVADLMLAYTGGKSQRRHAVLAGNIQGGSAFEIWQYTSREPQAPKFTLQPGDLGLFAVRVKAHDVQISSETLKSRGVDILGEVAKDPGGNDHFFIKDPFGMIFQIVKGDHWFSKGKHQTGGACGCMIGVSDIDKARSLYSDILGYNETIYDETGVFQDLKPLNGGGEKVRRVLLTHKQERKGSLSRWLGPSRIELIQSIKRKPKKIFTDRYWGDLGFIHLCFDIHGMKLLQEECKEKGFPFTVDSSTSFDMGDASGHFSYIEDPDGTLIEFVETYKIPIVKKLGLYLNLKKRNPEKPLPNWMLKTLFLSRIKD